MMTLNHDQVRALLAMHREELCEQHDAERPEDCSLCGLHAVGVALAEEWLAARTVRWDGFDLETLRGEFVGSALSGIDGWLACFGAANDDPEHECASEAEARAWLEAKAREAGYEVAT